MKGFEAETWVIDRGDDVIQKKAGYGYASLKDIEKLILHLWEVDYCMRNAGDLANLNDLSPNCLSHAEELASALDLDVATSLFSLRAEAFEQQYFSNFDDVTTELSTAVDGSK